MKPTPPQASAPLELVLCLLLAGGCSAPLLQAYEGPVAPGTTPALIRWKSDSVFGDSTVRLRNIDGRIGPNQDGWGDSWAGEINASVLPGHHVLGATCIGHAHGVVSQWTERVELDAAPGRVYWLYPAVCPHPNSRCQCTVGVGESPAGRREAK